MKSSSSPEFLFPNFLAGGGRLYVTKRGKIFGPELHRRPLLLFPVYQTFYVLFLLAQ
jgi:hypothetical protein